MTYSDTSQPLGTIRCEGGRIVHAHGENVWEIRMDDIAVIGAYPVDVGLAICDNWKLLLICRDETWFTAFYEATGMDDVLAELNRRLGDVPGRGKWGDRGAIQWPSDMRGLAINRPERVAWGIPLGEFLLRRLHLGATRYVLTDEVLRRCRSLRATV